MKQAAQAAVLDPAIGEVSAAVRAVAVELSTVTEKVLKCGKPAYAGDASPMTTASAATMARPMCPTLRESRFGF